MARSTKLFGFIALPVAAIAASSAGAAAFPTACTTNLTVACMQANGFSLTSGITAPGSGGVMYQFKDSTGAVLNGAGTRDKVKVLKSKTTCGGKNAEECIDCVNINFDLGVFASCKPLPNTCYASNVQKCMNLFSKLVTPFTRWTGKDSQLPLTANGRR